jgi:hypothetical protein
MLVLWQPQSFLIYFSKLKTGIGLALKTILTQLTNFCNCQFFLFFYKKITHEILHLFQKQLTAVLKLLASSLVVHKSSFQQSLSWSQPGLFFIFLHFTN